MGFLFISVLLSNVSQCSLPEFSLSKESNNHYHHHHHHRRRRRRRRRHHHHRHNHNNNHNDLYLPSAVFIQIEHNMLPEASKSGIVKNPN